MEFNRHDLRRIAKITGISAASLVAAITQASGAPPRELIYPERPSLILPESALSREERGMMQKLAIIPGLGFVPAFGGGAAGLTVVDVFSTSAYTGNGATQAVTNGINLSGEGGLVWIKRRNASQSHRLFDTARAATNYIATDAANAEASGSTMLTSFNSNGFSLGADSTVNVSAGTYASWSFRKAAKFFDVLTYTGDGSGNTRTLAHNLSIAPGMMIIKRRDTSENWLVRHRSLSSDRNLFLNTIDADDGPAGTWSPTTTTVTIAGSKASDYNASGATYVVYLFAHDTDPTGMVQCGSYTGNGSSTGPVVTLGWQPQFLIIKKRSATGYWIQYDTVRMPSNPRNNIFYVNLTAAEGVDAGSGVAFSSTGFQPVGTGGDVNNSGETYVYLAIRAAS